MNDTVKVEVSSEGKLVGFSTYDRMHGSRGRFLVAWHLVMKALTAPLRQVYYDMDCGNFVEMWQEDTFLILRFTWLSAYDRDRVQGYTQTIRIPKRMLLCMYDKTCKRKYLSWPEHRQAQIDASEASKTIRKVLENKYARRAFSKAMRDLFQWPGDRVKLYWDGGYNFYFTTKSGFPKCGGLILHEDGRTYGYPSLYYSIHT